MEDFIFAPIVLVFGLVIHAAVLRRHEAWEARPLTIAFAAHMVAGFAQVLLTEYYFGGGDMFTYYAAGVEVAEMVRDDVARFLPEVMRAFLQREYDLPIPMFGGGATQSMSSVAVFLLLTFGNSLYASVLLISLGSYFSQVLLYRALKNEFPREQQERVLWGLNLLPTAVFWSSGLLKEPVTMAAVGPLVYSLKLLSEGRRRVLALALLVPSAVTIAMVKPYVLMAISVAAAVFYLWKRFRTEQSAALRPFAVITAVAIGGAGLVLGNNFFGKADEASAAAALAHQRANGYATEGGSNFQIDQLEGKDLEKRSLAQELLLAPLALGTSLFRPFLFEARNVMQLANAFEATMLIVLFIRIIRRTSLGAVVRYVSASPALLFCVVFTLALGVGTGLATTNMGTLSRYRAPMMPFYFTVLLVLDQWSTAQARRTVIRPAIAAR